MFCNQCEQTTRNASGIGCTVQGVCGKTSKTSSLQDVIIYAVEGISTIAYKARQLGVSDPEVNRFTAFAMFTTLTNVNFDDDSLFNIIEKGGVLIKKIKDLYDQACQKNNVEPEKLTGSAAWKAPHDLLHSNIKTLIRQGDKLSFLTQRGTANKDIDSLRAVALFGLKGLCAYTFHAKVLGNEDETVYAGIQEAFKVLAENKAGIEELLTLSLKVGEINLKAMEILDNGATTKFGHPEPTHVNVNYKKGHSILVSGHDLVDLDHILKQTAGKDINVYTHGELLPANAYPALKKYPHLIGNFGGAWQDQQKDFADFKGAIVMTSNCIIEPQDTYKDRIFTTGPVGWSGLMHITDHDYSEVIATAEKVPGFEKDQEEKTILTGFAHNAVLGVADKIIETVKSGAIKRFYVIGGCDGARPERQYFADVANNVSKEGVILTLGCAKYRFNKTDFGDIGGIPRLLDVGQCNDSYSAIQIALALANAFECGVNDLPLSYYISWFEQKAVVALLSLLSLGIKNIHLGPTLPSFITENVLNILVEKFDLKPTVDAKADLAAELKAS